MQETTEQFHSAIELSQSNSVASKAPVCPACRQRRARSNQAQWNSLVTSRERFWILRGREEVKQIISKCVICRQYEGTPYRSQPSSDLSSERVSEDPPFTHVGLDFAGPLFVDDRNITEGANESSKVYVCLFTCASTRAVQRADPRSQCSSIPISLQTIGNPGSLCVTRDITQVNYREHMRRSLRLKICWKMELKIVETYYVASFCCP